MDFLEKKKKKRTFCHVDVLLIDQKLHDQELGTGRAGRLR